MKAPCVLCVSPWQAPEKAGLLSSAPHAARPADQGGVTPGDRGVGPTTERGDLYRDGEGGGPQEGQFGDRPYSGIGLGVDKGAPLAQGEFEQQPGFGEQDDHLRSHGVEGAQPVEGEASSAAPLLGAAAMGGPVRQVAGRPGEEGSGLEGREGAGRGAEPGHWDREAEPGGWDRQAEPGLGSRGAEPGHWDREAEPGLGSRGAEPGHWDRQAEPGLGSRGAEPGHWDMQAEPGLGSRGAEPGHWDREAEPGLGSRGAEPEQGARGDQPWLGAGEAEPGLGSRGAEPEQGARGDQPWLGAGEAEPEFEARGAEPGLGAGAPGIGLGTPGHAEGPAAGAGTFLGMHPVPGMAENVKPTMVPVNQPVFWHAAVLTTEFVFVLLSFVSVPSGRMPGKHNLRSTPGRLPTHGVLPFPY